MSKHNIKPYYDIKFKHVAGNISMIGGPSFDNFIINLLGVSELQRRDIKDINVVISAKQYNLRLNLSNVHLMSAEQFRSKIEKICLEATIFKKFIENVNSKEYNITTVINTHDMNTVMESGDHIVYMYQGNKQWEGTNKEIIFSKDERLNAFIFASDFLTKAKEMSMIEAKQKDKV